MVAKPVRSAGKVTVGRSSARCGGRRCAPPDVSGSRPLRSGLTNASVRSWALSGHRYSSSSSPSGRRCTIFSILRDGGVPFGFGGIGSLSRKDLPVDPECVLAEQVLQGATRGWLSRTFREVPAAKLPEEVCKIRNAIEFWRSADPGAQAEIRAQLRCQILSASANIDHSAQMR